MLQFWARISAFVMVIATVLVGGAALVGHAMPTDEIALDPLSANGRRDITLLDLGRNLHHRLTYDSADYFSPVWSPDGQQLAYIAIRDDKQSLVVRDVYGGCCARTVFTTQADVGGFNSANLVSAAWSPDGERIAFTAWQEVGQVVYIINVDGERNPQQLTANIANAISPTWSPDGKMLAFSWSPAANVEVFAAPVEGLEMPVRSDRVLERLTANPSYESWPAWSPDGRYIAFTSDRDDNSEIYVIDAACVVEPDECEGTMRRLTRHTARDVAPSWTPDGQYLLFASNRGGEWAVYQLDANCAISGECSPLPLIQNIDSSTHASWRP